MNQDRTIKIIGKPAIEKLKNSKIAVFGAGGVGGGTIEALARIGIGSLDIIDKDIVEETNLNRQIIATVSTIGRDKAVVAKERILSINPNCNVNAIKLLITPDTISEINFNSYDFIVDCVDDVNAKISIISEAKRSARPIITSMGTGNKLDPTRFKVTDISKTSVCPLARVIRRELRERDIKGVDALWSDETPVCNTSPPGSISFVPPVAGMIIGGFVVKKIITT